jgi:hypothetical protein
MFVVEGEIILSRVNAKSGFERDKQSLPMIRPHPGKSKMNSTEMKYDIFSHVNMAMFNY